MQDKYTSIKSVEYLLESVPETKDNYKLLILLYWNLFDNIDIPPEVIKDIVKKGTSPESITRISRMIKERTEIADNI